MTATATTLPAEAVLDSLRDLAARSPRFSPGVADVGPLTVHYTDARSLYVEYKDIFCNRIYHVDGLGPAPRIIDGGGCIGMSVLYFKAVYPDAEIVCFEPDADVFQTLQRNVAVNDLRDVQLVQAGLAGEAATRRFRPDHADGGKIDDDGDMAVETVRLSEYLDRPADLVKLNIEGQEWAVVRETAAAGRLGNARRFIIEYHGWSGGKQTLGAILDLFDRHGFRYIVHDFDAETCPNSKPPFRLGPARDWYCLIYAENMSPPTERGPSLAERNGDRGAAGPVHWGDLRRLTPISRVFGLDRGLPVDRHYIETFLKAHHQDIRGDVLEVGGDEYTRRFGAERVRRGDVLHAVEGHSKATIVGDLAKGRGIPSAAFDCIILTQTLQHIFDVRSAVTHALGALRPGGVLLATMPGISQISRYDMDRWGDYWRFTSLSARRLFETALPVHDLTVETHGNVLAATAFIQGLAAEDLTPDELALRDSDYELVITVRAVRAARDP